ncbi:CAF17-like 4Fe-4S cluster assembly/insertion protein YgfZ [Undibacterium fentianense]|uniref:Folate-binding protein YgfZ n=1 Tax=Undibacterium fentianense TaxID=2828728 RepID=A0A941E061_9BURK|nr:folate-binding protein YgfZ [Undibacterium fentianense]MBR7798582.1 folate-binding protein YgfZ [Undibacterium fentianense]
MQTNLRFLDNVKILDVADIDPSRLSEGYICELNDLSLVAASGEDAATFLHSQLSNDVAHINEAQSRYAAYCSPKGRMLASLLYWKKGNDILMQCSASLQPAFQKRLQMFVMRAKVKLEDISAQYVQVGLSGRQAEEFLIEQFASLPQEINQTISAEAGTLIRLHDAFDLKRYQWIVRRERFQEVGKAVSTRMMCVSNQVWRLGNILAGVPQVIESSKEQFVPQMINFELIGGVNFKKGCYPGQEIVARSQYLGKLKRRMAIAKIMADEVNTGMEVYSDNDPSQPCGMIVNAERDFDGSFSCLVEIKLVDQEEGKVHLHSATGSVLHFLPLPYAYLDITE